MCARALAPRIRVCTHARAGARCGGVRRLAICTRYPPIPTRARVLALAAVHTSMSDCSHVRACACASHSRVVACACGGPVRWGAAPYYTHPIPTDTHARARLGTCYSAYTHVRVQSCTRMRLRLAFACAHMRVRRPGAVGWGEAPCNIHAIPTDTHRYPRACVRAMTDAAIIH